MTNKPDMIELPRDVVLAWRETLENIHATPESMALFDAINAAAWEPPVATIPWVSVEDHPLPWTGTTVRYLLKWTDGVTGTAYGHYDRSCPARITHWCALPEVSPSWSWQASRSRPGVSP